MLLPNAALCDIFLCSYLFANTRFLCFKNVIIASLLYNCLTFTQKFFKDFIKD